MRNIFAAILAVCSIAFLSVSPAEAKRLRSVKVHTQVTDCFTDRGYGGNCGAAWWQVEEGVGYRTASKGKKSRIAKRSHGGTVIGGSSFLVERARAYMGQTASQIGLHRRTLWCSAFMQHITGASGVDDRARSWLSKPRIGAQVGAIAVLSRGKRGGGHVGVVSGFDARGNPIIVSGNHGRRVGEGVYPASRVLAYVSAS